MQLGVACLTILPEAPHGVGEAGNANCRTSLIPALRRRQDGQLGSRVAAERAFQSIANVPQMLRPQSPLQLVILAGCCFRQNSVILALELERAGDVAASLDNLGEGSADTMSAKLV